MSRLLLGLLLLLVLAACEPTGTQEGSGVNRYVDAEYGIVCYWRYGGSAPLSCATMGR